MATMGPCAKFVALLALGLFLNYLLNFSRVQALTSGDASMEMWKRHQNEEMPDGVRGVLWMRGNTCPELLLTLEAGAYDTEARTLLMPFGTAYSWSYNSDFVGWVEFAAVTANTAFFSPGKLRLEFDEDFRFASVQITVAGIGLAKNLWAMNQTDDDGDFWDRLGWDSSESTWQFKYDIRKVLDADGSKLPAWSEMVNSTISEWVVHGSSCGCTTQVKTHVQLLHGDFSMLPEQLS